MEPTENIRPKPRRQTLRRRVGIFLCGTVLTVIGFNSVAAQSIDVKLFERHLMSRVCNEFVESLPSSIDEIATAKAHWAKREAEITPDYTELVAKAHAAAKPELDALGEEEMAATCATEFLLDEIKKAKKPSEVKMTDAERIRLEKFEARMADVQRRLEPLSEEAQISGKFPLLYASVALGAATYMSEDEVFESQPLFFEKLLAAMETQSKAKAVFGDSKKDVQRLLEYNEFSMRSCQWASEAAIHKAIETKDFDLATDSLIRSALWQGLINYRRTLGGAKSNDPEPAVIQKLYDKEPLELSDELMKSTLETGCGLGLIKNKKTGKKIFLPFVGAPIKAAKQVGQTAEQSE